ncbi:ubiquinone biosynthesis methyltransferase UbiE [Pikeienuella piscinae]|uniref:Ubiquinone biosynthesis methyltransferase UbiE n=1 Tax=Pikeienuella piscinae TaxID=2748098 RepID=A0A7M3T7H7_9RHOB|nr:ubiquinone biosynthesis methyltransferase UbiE [Pikeienuella piscinae]
MDAARAAFVIKWVASLFQIAGYGATGLGLEPWNILLFLVGVLGWFTVGLLWGDRALILVHLVAFAAMIAGAMSR